MLIGTYAWEGQEVEVAVEEEHEMWSIVEQVGGVPGTGSPIWLGCPSSEPSPPPRAFGGFFSQKGAVRVAERLLAKRGAA